MTGSQVPYILVYTDSAAAFQPLIVLWRLDNILHIDSAAGLQYSKDRGNPRIRGNLTALAKLGLAEALTLRAGSPHFSMAARPWL